MLQSPQAACVDISRSLADLSPEHKSIHRLHRNNLRHLWMDSKKILLVSDPHRHHDVLVLVITIFRRMQFCLRIAVFELERYFSVTNYVQEFLQVLCVEADVSYIAGVICLDGFIRFTFFSVLRTDYQLIRLEVETNRMRSFVSHQRNSSD